MTDVLSRHLQEPSAAPAAAPAPWPAGPGKIRYGGDYNPEQWSRETWAEDISLMQEAGINLVSIGIFSWVLLEPSEGRYEFGWLDELMDLLGGAGIGVDLGTPTAAPPAWFWKKYPQALPVTRDGVRLGGGSRGMASPSSLEYRRAATGIADQLAARYGNHPALVMWHVHNEYGAPVSESYDDASVEAFRIWLQNRYGTLDDLNEAWGTTFWGQRYGQWDEIDAPRTSASVTNQTQRLDFRRFTSDALLQCFIAERDVLRAHTPAIPITTNFMSTNCLSADYWAWSKEVDVVSNDHYLVAQREDNHILLSMDADLTRSFAGNRPWILMEHSTSAVNWQGRNIAKRAGEMARNSTAHVARGADAIMFFQFRAARYGAEKFHSTMLPQSGRNSRIWREVVALGESLDTLSMVRGSTVKAKVALLWDVESFWAMDLEWRPSDDLNHRERIEAFYAELWKQGVTVDFAHPAQDLSQYDLVIAPSLYMVGTAAEANLHSYVAAGGHLLVSYFSGIVDANDAVPAGAYPGALRDILGLEIHEFLPLRLDQKVTLDNGASGSVWSEEVHAGTAQVLTAFADGPAAGGPALTRNSIGAGTAWYVATRLEGGDLGKLLSDVVREAGLEPVDGLPEGLEVVARSSGAENFTFLINHADVDAHFNGRGTELLTGEEIAATVVVPAGGIRVLHEQ